MTQNQPMEKHAITPHLTVDGAADAIEFYKKAFGAEEIMRMASPDGKLIHASFTINGAPLMINDEYPEFGARGPKSVGGTPVTIHLNVDDVDSDWKRAVDAGATIVMPLDNQPWGDRYGILTDPFGHSWSMSTHVEDVSPEEIARRMADMGGNQ